MKASKWTVPAAIALFVSGIIFGATCFNVSAIAQNPIQKSTGAYQISAHGDGNGIYGCFLLDTATGDVWQATNGGTFRMVPKVLMSKAKPQAEAS